MRRRLTTLVLSQHKRRRLGGVALAGGRGNVLGTLFAAGALVLLNNTFNLLELDTNLQSIAKGLVFILALVFFMRGKAGEA